jgi:hypothetical protein
MLNGLSFHMRASPRIVGASANVDRRIWQAALQRLAGCNTDGPGHPHLRAIPLAALDAVVAEVALSVAAAVESRSARPLAHSMAVDATKPVATSYGHWSTLVRLQMKWRRESVLATRTDRVGIAGAPLVTLCRSPSSNLRDRVDELVRLPRLRPSQCCSLQ